MPDGSSARPIISFGKPEWLPRWLVLRIIRFGLIIGATLVSLSTPRQGQDILPRVLLVEFVVFCLAMAVNQVRLRRRGGLPPILLGPENLTVPRHALSMHTATVPYADIRSIVVRGRGRAAWIVIDTAKRAWSFPHRSFADSDALDRMRQGLGQHVEGLADGPARWQAITARHELAEQIAGTRAWGTWAIAAVTLACFAAQTAFVGRDGGFGLIDAGGNSALLVHDGEWFRLFTGSLLHENARHVVGNVLFIVVLGGILEPLIGLRQIVLVMLLTCVGAGWVSAEFALDHGNYLVAIGNSGGVYGLVGALAAVTWRFGAHLPGGFRLPARMWALFGVGFALAPFVATRVDHAAHAGGLVCGLILGLLLLRGRTRLGQTPRRAPVTNLALAAVCCAWLAAVGQAVLHETSTASRQADRYALAKGMLDHDHFPPGIKNPVAWAIATDLAAPSHALEDARQLAQRGVIAESQSNGPNTRLGVAIRDTEAVLDHRLGQDDAAIQLELPLVYESLGAAGTHLAMFAEAAWHQHGLQEQGDAGDAPVLAIDHGVLRLSRTTPVASQTDVLALVHHQGALAGVLRFQLMTGFSGMQVLPLPSSRGAPSTAAPPPVWTDGNSTIDIARMDADGCHCRWPTLVPAYYPYLKKDAYAP